MLRFPALLVFVSALAPCLPAAADDFGFTGPEIFPIDYGIGNLRAADLDGDGLNDLVVANNKLSRITLLYNRTGKEREPDAEIKVGTAINDLPPDARFRKESIASEKRIASLVVADLNDDKKPDLAYYGEPKELIVQYNQGKEGWSTPKRWPIDDGQLTPNALTAQDINGDKKNDVVLLAESHLYILRQTDSKSFAAPERFPFSGDIKSVQILDIDGNRLNDFLLVNWDNPNPFRFRLQTAPGLHGPEIYFDTPPVRSYWADDLDGDGKTEIITIAMKSGRAQISNFLQSEAELVTEDVRAGLLQVLPLQRTGKGLRGNRWADLNGDGRSDLLVAEPDSSQMTVFLQKKDGSILKDKTVPSLAGVTEIVVLPPDRGLIQGEGPEIFLLSTEERQVGVTRFEKDGRIRFPAPLPLKGRPLALGAGPLTAKGDPAVAVVVEGASQSRELSLHTAGNTVTRIPLNKAFKSNPAGLRFHDMDQDGLMDVVVLVPYEKIKILRQKKDLEFEELDIAPPGGSLERPWVSPADVDGDGKAELLLGQKNFVRAVVLQNERPLEPGEEDNWSFRVVDQINGVSSRSRIIGATALPRDSGSKSRPVPWLFLLDAQRKLLSLCQRDTGGVWQILHNFPLPFSDFQSMDSIALDSGKPNTVAFQGLNAAGWLTFSDKSWEMAELDSYETPIQDGRLFDVVSGDLNQDGRKDLVFLETAKNYLDLVQFSRDGTLKPANRWPVFQKRTFRGRRVSDQMEPREALIVELTGDKRNDLAIVVHDRILVYPQE